MAILFLLTGLSMQAQSGGDLFSGSWKARDVVIPFFMAPEQEPSLVLRVEKIYTDYERRGFFRIGVLPVGVMEGVTFDVRQVASITNSLARLHRWLGPGAANRLEFRQVSLQIAGTVTKRLRAGRIQVLPGGKWELLDGVSFSEGTHNVQAAHATLQIAGEQTGTLVMAGTLPWTNNIFAFTPSDPSKK